uniref:Viral alkaline exonuclease n=1 Tax=Anatid alphaherpesvirus 2 TaxID=3080522 RepID=A0AAU0K882_9ALPH
MIVIGPSPTADRQEGEPAEGVPVVREPTPVVPEDSDYSPTASPRYGKRRRRSGESDDASVFGRGAGDGADDLVYCGEVIGGRFGPVPACLSASIHSYDFYEYMYSEARRLLADGDAEGFASRPVEPIYHRLMYVLRLLRTMDSEGMTISAAEMAFGGASSASDASELKAALGSEEAARNVCLAVEAETTPQAGCDLWTILRKCLMTASTIKWDRRGPKCEPDLRVVDTATRSGPPSNSIAFGNANESLARSALVACVLGPGYAKTPDGLDPSRLDDADAAFTFDAAAALDSEPYSCGLLIDPRTGMIGASMDVLACDRGGDGLLRPHPLEKTLEIYEIKCRAKYLFVPGSNTEPAMCYDRLMRERSPGAFRRFIMSIKRPCVEYFTQARGTPGTCEALATCHDDWKTWAGPEPTRPGVRARRARCGEVDTRHLELNKAGRSSVWLFSDPDLDTLEIGPLPWSTGELSLDVPIFANPRHQNFKQILVQAYVLAAYYPDRTIAPHLVTFIGRERRRDELGRRFTLLGPSTVGCVGSGQTVSPEQAIPVALVVTPVRLDESLFGLIEEAGREAFSIASEEIWAKSRLPSTDPLPSAAATTNS